MKFEKPILEGIFQKRYKRFFADIELNGELITAHVPNTGSMKSCLFEGEPCRVTHHNDPKRKLQYTLEMTRTPQGKWIGVNTGLPNKMALEAFEKKLFPNWSSFQFGFSEIKVSEKTRLDLILTTDKVSQGKKPKWDDLDPKMYDQIRLVEIKNVTLKEGKKALFPDGVSARAQKHLKELMEFSKKGIQTEVLFTVQRSDVNSFSPSKEFDPEYAQLFKEALDQGVTMSPYLVKLSKSGVELTDHQLPIEI